ncbi:MAG: tyrosine-protein phosphatase [Eggerthellaceae bacterium]|nr:tyrosine-protein phosphatase [Eggerthellaceae bacterium]MBQ9044240.1 tyrosine-protein phosphatase [Eggerthellaceae bacterium]
MSRLIEFEGLSNTRDLGGMLAVDGRRIREGLLYRSEQLFFATEGDRAKLDTLGIGKVFDFRSALERDEKPDPDIAGAENAHLPIIEDVRTGITRGDAGNERMIEVVMSGKADIAFVDQHMQGMYTEFVTEPFAHGQYARFVDEALAEAEQGKAVLWHCTAGKDRAGFATVIVLEALGVPRDDIVADYLQTNECLAGSIDNIMAMLAERLPSMSTVDVMRHFFLADESYLRAAYDAIDDRFGSVDAFLEQALRIDAAKREKMQTLYLE